MDVKPHDPADPDTELQTLRNTAEHWPVIEQAKGMVMMLLSCDEEQASAVLREISQHANTKLHDVAAIIVAAGIGAPPLEDDAVARMVLTDVRCTALGGPFTSP